MKQEMHVEQTKDFSRFDAEDWQNPLVLGTNRLPLRASGWGCPDARSGWESDYDRSPWAVKLNGPWKFSWAKDPTEAVEGFERVGFDDSHWDEIAVPGCWEIEGMKAGRGALRYGVPIYSNYNYAFATRRFGHVMDAPPREYTTFEQRNPVGSYRVKFTVPASWPGDGRRILHFAGVYSAMRVWVNGREAGFSKDSRLPAEFDVTDLLVAGENELAVRVWRWSDGSYLECQDFWRLSGIYRDVFLVHTPTASVWDCYVDTELAEDFRSARVGLRYTIRNEGEACDDLRIRVTLRDPMGLIVGGGALIDEPVGRVGHGFADERLTASATVTAPLLWTNETPHVYDVLVELLRDGRVIETRRLDVGFRKVEILGRTLCVNGVPIKVKGVNRHEVTPDGGYVVSREVMERDLALMKQANVNFVRCSHYPNDPRWYALCNRWGMFVIDEANVESHGLSYHKKVLPGDDPRWEPACVSRMERMVVRDRNHPCVIMWSLGNEAGYGKAFLKMREAARARDPQKRPIQYADMNMAGDVDSQTYPTIEWCHEHLAGKAVRKGERGEIGVREQHGPYPSGRGFVANEYAHAHGNGVGNLQDYWDMFEAHDLFWGGFIWEWVDQTIYRLREDGSRVLAMGGDFGDVPNDGRFCVKGLITSEREPRPHYWEVRKVYQYVAVRWEDAAAGLVRVRNKHFFSGMNHLKGQWVLEEDGTAIAQGELEPIEARPGEETVVRIPWGTPALKADAEYLLTVGFVLRESTPWAPAGSVVAWEQLAVREKAAQRTGQAIIRGRDVAVDEATGLIERVEVSGIAIGRIVPNFWRAVTDNDIGWNVAALMGAWRDAFSTAELRSIERGELTTVRWCLPAVGSEVAMTYAAIDGGVRVGMELEVGKDAPELPRFGVMFTIPGSLRQVRWFGRGPWENYIDRKTGSAVGIHAMDIERFITPNVRPQENGHREDVRWIEFADSSGSGVRIRSVGGLMGMNAWPYTLEDLKAATHNHLLPRRDEITVCIDGFHMGVGGDNSWGATVHEQYRLMKKGRYGIVFEVTAIGDGPERLTGSIR